MAVASRPILSGVSTMGLKNWTHESRVLDDVLTLREWALDGFACVVDGALDLGERVLSGLAWTRACLRRLLSRVIPLTIWQPRPKKPRSSRLELERLGPNEGPNKPRAHAL